MEKMRILNIVDSNRNKDYLRKEISYEYDFKFIFSDVDSVKKGVEKFKPHLLIVYLEDHVQLRALFNLFHSEQEMIHLPKLILVENDWEKRILKKGIRISGLYIIKFPELNEWLKNVGSLGVDYNKKKKILYVEDSRAMHQFMTEVFKNRDYELLHGLDGEEGYRLYYEHYPDLIITDLEMPKMNGLNLCRKIKEENRGRYIPIIIMSSRDHPLDINQAFQYGADDYLIKPVVKESILHKTDEFLSVLDKQKKSKVLISDDDKIFLELSAHALEMNHLNYFLTEGLDSAFKIVRLEKPEVWVLSREIYDEESMEVKEKISNLISKNDMTLFIVSRNEDYKKWFKDVDLSVVDYFIKPFPVQELIDQVKIKILEKYDIIKKENQHILAGMQALIKSIEEPERTNEYLSEYLYHQLSSIPGVKSAFLLIKDKILHASMASEEDRERIKSYLNEEQDHEQKFQNRSDSDLYFVRLTAGREILGHLIFLLNEKKLFFKELPYLQNLSKLISIIVNHHEREERLVNLNDELKRQINEKEIAEKELLDIKNNLEEMVKKRTEDLNKTNEALREEEKALEISEERLKLVLEATSDGIWDWNREKNRFFYSSMVREIFGFGEKTFNSPLSLYKRTHPDDRELVKDVVRSLRQGSDNREFEFRVKDYHGGYKWILGKGKAVEFNEKGESSRVVGIFVDISEKKKLEERLSRAEKMESVGRLAGGVAHDLNNMLMGILTYPDLIMKKLQANDPLLKYVRKIKESGIRASEVVQDLLTLSRRVTVKKTKLFVNDVIKQYLNSPEFQFNSKDKTNVSLSMELQKDIYPVNGSRLHLYKTIMNLINNAFDAIEDHGEIVIKTENILISNLNESDQDIKSGYYNKISVIDDGEGISPENLNKIFDPFYSDKQYSKKSGTGLGLAIVWGTIQDHNGFIDVESEPGKGTAFYLWIPAVYDSSSIQVFKKKKVNKVILTGNNIPSLYSIKQFFDDKNLPCDIKPVNKISDKFSPDIQDVFLYDFNRGEEEKLDWLFSFHVKKNRFFLLMDDHSLDENFMKKWEQRIIFIVKPFKMDRFISKL